MYKLRDAELARILTWKETPLPAMNTGQWCVGKVFESKFTPILRELCDSAPRHMVLAMPQENDNILSDDSISSLCCIDFGELYWLDTGNTMWMDATLFVCADVPVLPFTLDQLDEIFEIDLQNVCKPCLPIPNALFSIRIIDDHSAYLTTRNADLMEHFSKLDKRFLNVTAFAQRRKKIMEASKLLQGVCDRMLMNQLRTGRVYRQGMSPAWIAMLRTLLEEGIIIPATTAVVLTPLGRLRILRNGRAIPFAVAPLTYHPIENADEIHPVGGMFMTVDISQMHLGDEISLVLDHGGLEEDEPDYNTVTMTAHRNGWYLSIGTTDVKGWEIEIGEIPSSFGTNFLLPYAEAKFVDTGFTVKVVDDPWLYAHGPERCTVIFRAGWERDDFPEGHFLSHTIAAWRRGEE